MRGRGPTATATARLCSVVAWFGHSAARQLLLGLEGSWYSCSDTAVGFLLCGGHSVGNVRSVGFLNSCFSLGSRGWLRSSPPASWCARLWHSRSSPGQGEVCWAPKR